jgi:hypothetical protein
MARHGCSGSEVAAAGLVTDETGESPLQLGDLASPSPQLAPVGPGSLEAAEVGDAHADLLE